MTWLRREDLEDLELRTLARFATHSRHAGHRRLKEAPDSLRTPFQRDRDRIIHAAAFRRLQHKTQVVAAYEGDHYRSRMTHSLEVSQMARGVARALRLNSELAEAVALAHDLGHPPFGHVGEDALQELMADHGGFRHNAQGVRIVDYLEDPYGHGHGLNLTHATRRSLLKGKIPGGFPVSSDLSADDPTPVEAQVVDYCDRIAYLCHDLDDGLRAGAFSIADASELELWQLTASGARGAPPSIIISRTVSRLIHDLVRATDAAWERHRSGDPPPVQHSPHIRELAREWLEFLGERFYRSPSVLSVMRDGQRRIRAAFERFSRNPDELPERARTRIEHDGVERVTCDYIAGMTDRFLIRHKS